MPPETLPTFAIAIIVRDGEKTLPGLLTDLIARTKDGHWSATEYVIVDTGSEDRTRELVAEAFRAAQLAGDGWSGLPVWPVESTPEGTHVITHLDPTTRLTLARLDWPHDFAKARNYSYSLVRDADWVMYLDADDRFEDFRFVRQNLADIVKREPDVNCLSVIYDYAPGVVQDVVFRIVRRKDGWVWERPIHERLARIGNLPRHILRVGWRVKHAPSDDHGAGSVMRNFMYAERSYNDAIERGDEIEAGMCAFHLGEYHDILNEPEKAATYLSEAIERLGPNNIGVMAAIRLALVRVQLRQYDRALMAAGAAVAFDDAVPDVHGVMALVRFMRGEVELAVESARRFLATPEKAISTVRDALLRGKLLAFAAQALSTCGFYAEAQDALGRVEGAAVTSAEAADELLAARVQVARDEGRRRLLAYVDYLLWNCSAGEALDVLARPPTALRSDDPALLAKHAFIEARREFLSSREKYGAAYASIPDAQFHTTEEGRAGVLNLGRARAAVAWARANADRGPVYSLTVGAQDGIIERAMLEANPNLFVCVCDVAPQAGVPLAKLVADFPGRVALHVMDLVGAGYTDWPVVYPGTQAPFDLAMLFEVIEHVPHATHAWQRLCTATPKGTILMSTPRAECWVEPYLSEPRTAPSFYGHVRAFNMETLGRLVASVPLAHPRRRVRVEATDGGTLYLVTARVVAHDTWPTDQLGVPGIVIHVPGTPHPFGPESHLRGHLGGSEEAVIHLAQALGELGSSVAVFTPTPAMEDGTLVLADRNVEWRGVEEFSPLMPGPSVVLFWREPRLLLDPAVQQAPYTKVLWLHDTGYGAPPEAYYAADVVAVVSEAHIDVLCAEEKLDKSRVNFLVLGNGIDGAELAAVIGRHLPRDPLRVVYGSSPDRGLIDLLTIWPEVVKQVPGAHLDVYYSWDMARARNPRLVAELEELLARCGDSAVHHGGVDHQTLHEAYAQAGVWAYPTDFFEVSCITAMKVQALGCWPLTRAVGALPETLAPALEADPTPGAVFVESATGPDGRLDEKGLDAFRDALIARLRAPATENVRSAMQAAALGRFLWAQTAERLLGTLRAVRRDVAQRADERRKAWPAVAPLPPEGPASRR